MRPTTRDRIVLFCDCHEFSRLMAELGEGAFSFLDEMYNRCGECIVSRRGRIVKCVGARHGGCGGSPDPPGL